VYANFGQIDFELDTAGMAHAAWEGVEPDITDWLDATAIPKLTQGLADGFEQGLSQFLPSIKKELTPPQSTKAYLAIAGAWAVGVLMGIWIVARNTGRARG
jgi:hypothetical protein